MPVEAKPLFRPDVVRPHVEAFALPERVAQCQTKLDRWAELIRGGRVDAFNEKELLPDFLADIFVGLLGYARPVDQADGYTFSQEKHVQVAGEYADAVLGRFLTNQPPRFVVAVEGKGPKDPLDRPYAGRKMSAVDQVYRYAINLPCDWIIVTSIRRTRLYSKATDQQTYEQFDTEALANDERQLRRFVFLLGAERVVPVAGECHLYALRNASEKVGKELTKNYYVEYADIRQDMFEKLSTANPSEPRPDVLTAAQKLLDRVLFVAFSEDRGLLPADSLVKAYEHQDPYHPRPTWENFRGLFRSINEGNAALNIPRYNGGLFAADDVLDRLSVPDAVCDHFRTLGEFDYRPASEASIGGSDDGRGLIDVDILGHIFEQSIADLEKLRGEIDGLTERASANQRTRRRREGAFYTPSFITRYMVGRTLGAVLGDRFERLRKNHAATARGTARAILTDPRVYDMATLNNPQKEALVGFWEAWQDELAAVRIVDPSCGSGAFLIEAFDQLHAAYLASNDRLEELRGHRTLFDLDRKILQDNLYGVDLNEEAIEICKLSLWIKTAARGKVLTSLDQTIRNGNSIVADPEVHSRAFDWRTAFPEVFAAGGFDAVIGNPPYVRQELLAEIKPYLEREYRSFHGMADLYVYFYELGLRLLRPGGRMSFIVTNKWMRSGYGEPLRRLFGDASWMESVIDFGHAKQIFPDADVFPCIIVARKPTDEPPPETARVCAIPREQLRIDDLGNQIDTEGFDIDRSRLTADSWSLEPPGVAELLEKIASRAKTLPEVAGSRPYRGILTGFNEAFLIDTPTRDRLIAIDANAAAIIRPYLRGQDFERWCPEWAGLWMIAMKSSGDHSWPWSEAESEDVAEAIFQTHYPSLHAHFLVFEDRLRNRQDQGRYWWELRSCAYWSQFDAPKIMYQEITWRAQWSFDTDRRLCSNTAYILPTDDLWVLAVANSPIVWWYSWRTAMHGKDEALRFIAEFVTRLPIPEPTEEQRTEASSIVESLTVKAKAQSESTHTLLDWLLVEYEIEKPGKVLSSPVGLDSDAFVAEVKKRRGRRNPLSAAGLKALRDEHARTIEPAQALAREAVTLEHRLSDLVNEAYGLTPEEVALMWKTAPPRMPVAPPTP